MKNRTSLVSKATRNRIVIWGIGLALGVAMAFGYRAISPLPYRITLGWPPVLPVATSGGQQLYESRVRLEIVSRGAAIVSPSVLQKQGEYYSMRLISSPFVVWLSQQLAAQAPKYKHSNEELSQMIKIRFGGKNQAPSVQLRVQSPSAEEAFFLANMIPGAFQSYLITEERNLDLQAYQNNVKEAQTLRDSLIEARKALVANKLKIDSTGLNVNPSYISAEARVNSLTRKVNELAISIANLAAQGPNDGTVAETTADLNKAVASLADARNDLKNIQLKISSAGPGFDPSYIAAESKVNALSIRVNELSMKLASLVAPEQRTQYTETGAQLNQTIYALIAARSELSNLKVKKDNDTSNLEPARLAAQAKVNELERKLSELAAASASAGLQPSRESRYNETMAQLTRVVDTLVQAKKELVTLRAQEESNNLQMNEAYNESVDKIKTLENKFLTLSRSLEQSFDEESALLSHLPQIVVDEPSNPAPVPPDKISKRNTLMLGAVLGLGGTWLALNSRSVAKQIASFNAPQHETTRTEPAPDDKNGSG